MPSTREPTHYVLKRRIPNTQEWLGRVVQHYQDPTASFIPISVESTLSSTLSTNVISTTESDFHLNLVASRESSMATQISKLLNIGNTTSRSEMLDLHTRQITYHRLMNHSQVFDHLSNQQDMARRLLDLVPVGHKGYMIVGLVQIEPTSKITRSSQQSKSFERGMGLPLVEIATAAAGVPFSLGGVGDIEVESEGTANHHIESTGTSSGGCEIIAFEYRAVRRKLSGLGRKVVLRDSVINFKGGLTFQQRQDNYSEECSESEEDDADECEVSEGEDPDVFADLFAPRPAAVA
ncbi:MAG: hypothetical protein Q9168_002759 [Polycauliona sp. 1 TL-2023]